MSEEDIRYYEKRLAQELERAETEDDEHLRSVHAQFARAIEWKIRRIKKSTEAPQDVSPRRAAEVISVV